MKKFLLTICMVLSSFFIVEKMYTSEYKIALVTNKLPDGRVSYIVNPLQKENEKQQIENLCQYERAEMTQFRQNGTNFVLVQPGSDHWNLDAYIAFWRQGLYDDQHNYIPQVQSVYSVLSDRKNDFNTVLLSLRAYHAIYQIDSFLLTNIFEAYRVRFIAQKMEKEEIQNKVGEILRFLNTLEDFFKHNQSHLKLFMSIEKDSRFSFLNAYECCGIAWLRNYFRKSIVYSYEQSVKNDLRFENGSRFDSQSEGQRIQNCLKTRRAVQLLAIPLTFVVLRAYANAKTGIVSHMGLMLYVWGLGATCV